MLLGRNVADHGTESTGDTGSNEVDPGRCGSVVCTKAKRRRRRKASKTA